MYFERLCFDSGSFNGNMVYDLSSIAVLLNLPIHTEERLKTGRPLLLSNLSILAPRDLLRRGR